MMKQQERKNRSPPSSHEMRGGLDYGSFIESDDEKKNSAFKSPVVKKATKAKRNATITEKERESEDCEIQNVLSSSDEEVPITAKRQSLVKPSYHIQESPERQPYEYGYSTSVSRTKKLRKSYDVREPRNLHNLGGKIGAMNRVLDRGKRLENS